MVYSFSKHIFTKHQIPLIHVFLLTDHVTTGLIFMTFNGYKSVVANYLAEMLTMSYMSRLLNQNALIVLD